MRDMTLAELTTSVRFHAGLAFATAKVSDAQIAEELWYGMQVYLSLLSKHMIWTDVETATFTGTSATRYSITHPHRLISVDCRSATTGGWSPLRKSSLFFGDRTDGQRYSIEYSIGVPYSDVTYDRSLTYLTLHPKIEGQQLGKSFRVRYVRTLTQAQLLPSTGIAFPNGWEEVPILWAAIRCLARNKEDFSGTKFLFEAAVSRINAEASSLEYFQAQRAGDSRPEVFYDE